MIQADSPQALKIKDIKIENSYTKTLELDGSLPAAPGQFVMVWLPGLDEKPFSLAAADPIRLTIAAVGRFTKAVHQLRIGDRLWVRGPLGLGFRLPAQTEPPQKILQVGGGYGVAPLLFLAKLAIRKQHHVSMIIGASSTPNLLFVDAFNALNISLRLTTEDGSTGQQGRVTDAMSLLCANRDTKPQRVYACGPTAMLVAVARLCRREAIPFQLAWEAHMRCGIGLCGSCELGQGWLTCLDGPVFSFNPMEISPIAEMPRF